MTRNQLMLETKTMTLVQDELAHDSLHHPNLGGVTRGGMANHYPMTILALQGLGASDQEILNFKRHWPRSRALIVEDLNLQDTGTVQAENWTQYLGQSRYLREFRRVFLAALNQQNTAAAINQALAMMKDALPMGLFHPLIRLSFANSHQDKGQIADALAYMAIRYQDLFLTADLDTHKSESETLTGSVPAQAVWQHISQALDDADFQRPIRRGSLSICEDFCGQTAIQELALETGWTINADNLDQQIQAICLLALRLYLYQPALTTLHAVTAAQALAELKYSQDQTNTEIQLQLWRRYWVWLTGLFIEKGHPLNLPEISPEALPELAAQSWEQLAAQARKLPEVHLIKMTYSCQWLAQQLGEHPENHLYKLAVINLLREQAGK
jgi:hypothetical protein